MSSFGKACEKDFQLNFALCPVNHGSWGAVPRTVMDKRLRLQQLLESSPDHWFRRLFLPMWNENVDAAADFLGSAHDNLVLVPNATAGINCILKSIPFASSDAVLINTWTYKAIQNTCHSVITRAGGELLKVPMTIPIEDPSEVVEKYRSFLKSHSNVKLAVIDYISSATATKFPIRELTAVCKEFGAMVLIDGAHSPGQVEVNLEEMGAYGVDFYVGNFHKWVYCPRGCAALWVHPRHHAVIQPTVTGHSYNMARWRDNFSLQGTLDHTPYMVTKDAIAFYNDAGGMEKIVAYNSSIVDRAADMLAQKWCTRRFPIPKEMEAPFMKLVELPDIKTHPIPDEALQAPFGDSDLHTVLFTDHDVTTTAMYVEGRHWIRISGQIYNTMEHYEKLAEAVLKL